MVNTAMTGITRAVRLWVKREEGRGTVLTADAVWKYIRKKYGYLNEQELETVFQDAEDFRK